MKGRRLAASRRRTDRPSNARNWRSNRPSRTLRVCLSPHSRSHCEPRRGSRCRRSGKLARSHRRLSPCGTRRANEMRLRTRRDPTVRQWRNRNLRRTDGRTCNGVTLAYVLSASSLRYTAAASGVRILAESSARASLWIPVATPLVRLSAYVDQVLLPAHAAGLIRPHRDQVAWENAALSPAGIVRHEQMVAQFDFVCHDLGEAEGGEGGAKRLPIERTHVLPAVKDDVVDRIDAHSEFEIFVVGRRDD